MELSRYPLKSSLVLNVDLNALKEVNANEAFPATVYFYNNFEQVGISWKQKVIQIGGGKSEANAKFKTLLRNVIYLNLKYLFGALNL